MPRKGQICACNNPEAEYRTALSDVNSHLPKNLHPKLGGQAIVCVLPASSVDYGSAKISIEKF